MSRNDGGTEILRLGYSSGEKPPPGRMSRSSSFWWESTAPNRGRQLEQGPDVKPASEGLQGVSRGQPAKVEQAEGDETKEPGPIPEGFLRKGLDLRRCWRALRIFVAFRLFRLLQNTISSVPYNHQKHISHIFDARSSRLVVLTGLVPGEGLPLTAVVSLCPAVFCKGT